MSSSKLVLSGAAGALGGAGADIDEAFNVSLWTGTGSSQTIATGLNLSDGGMVWIKKRNDTESWWISDSERTLSDGLSTDSTSIFAGYTNRVTSISDGITVGTDTQTNGSGQEYVGYSFKSTEGFFSVITYTGNGTAGREIEHGLGTTPGMIWIKSTSLQRHWRVYHRSLGNASGLFLSTNAASAATTDFNNTSPTSTHFTVGGANNTNGNGATYVAYVFAHHDSNGTFGPDGDADAVHCGTYTTNGSGVATVDIGFEPQFILRKRTDASQDWGVYDVSRGIYQNNDYQLKPNSNTQEAGAGNQYNVNPSGFTVSEHNASATYVYMAIRRSNLFEPEDADNVFDVNAYTGNSTDNRLIESGFQTDFAMFKRRPINTNWLSCDRQRGGRGALYNLYPNKSDAENEPADRLQNIDYQNGVEIGTDSDVNVTSSGTYVAYQWKRARGFFDVVHYDGNSAAARAVPHSLQKKPEMMWIKCRSAVANWHVYHTGLDATNPSHKYVQLNLTNAVADWDGAFGDTEPTDTDFYVGEASNPTNLSGRKYVAYLFATVDGVSKVGSFTSDGTDMTIDCGFTAGARFVLLKKINVSDDWYIWDNQRGIVAGNDPRFKIAALAEATGADNIDPDNSGFIINNNILGGSGNDFIFYAIA